MLVAIDKLHPDSTPVRRRLWVEDDDALRASIAALGLLDPLLVVRRGDDFDEYPEYEVKDGNRRLAAARALGLLAVEVSELPRNKPDFTAAAATAANVVRAPLDPLDQWRAILTLQERGYTLPAAAAALGLSDRQAARLDKLGHLHPSMLALIEQHGVPTERTLAILAAAPLDLQQRAATGKGIVSAGWDKKLAVNWHTVTELCHRTRFPKTVAIFEVATAGLAWDQDFFAEPGSNDEWTTTDAPGFLKAQGAALEQQAAASKGRLRVVDENPQHPGEPYLPKGWRATHTDAAKPKRGETVFACVSRRTGAVVRATAIDQAAEKLARKEAEKKAKAKPAKPSAGEVPSALGTVGTPIATATTPAPAAAAQPAPADDEADAPPPPTPAAAKPPMTKEGQKLLARYKTRALRARLRDRTQPISNDILVPLLILALHATNVEIRGYDHGDRAYAERNGEDLVRRLVTPEGHLQFDGAELPFLAGEALARVLSFTEPDQNRYTAGSGDTAEWIAAQLDAQSHMPRLDTADFLATLSVDKLKNAAVLAGEKFTTAMAAKRDLAGKLPTWRPDYTHFGAPGPLPAKAG